MEYLGAYGSASALFERIVKLALAALATAALLGGIYYLFFRNWREERQAKAFFELLQARRYEEAYSKWGCSVEAPCRYYPYGEFLEDWGPAAPFGELSEYSLGRSYTQPGGVILRYTINGESGDPLWIERDPPVINFAPN
ncbi:MAG: hypothetical protein OXD30_08790 [Bryobacterales bacterium]|nr:hypothetical protein [Bryobacterales bacterium]